MENQKISFMEQIKKHSKVCHNPECKQPFFSKHKDTQYCSKKCKDRTWWIRHPNYNKARRAKNKEYFYKRTSNWARKFRAKYAAQMMAWRKISLINKVCQNCGASKNLHKHHQNYSNKLDVTILCAKCHSRLHHREKTNND